LTGS